MKEYNSLKEVWEWKESVYNETKNMKIEEQQKYFKEKTDRFIKSAGFIRKVLQTRS